MQAIPKLSLATLLAMSIAACSDSRTLTEPDRVPELSEAAAMDEDGGAVYVATNSPVANEVLVFPRAKDGSLGSPRAFATGGRGTGAGLGNQGGVVLSRNKRRLYVVTREAIRCRCSPYGAVGSSCSTGFPRGGCSR